MQGFTAESSQPCTSDTAQNSQKAIDRASGGTRKCLLSAQHEFKRFFDDIARSTKRPGSVGEHEGLLPNSKSCWCCAGRGREGKGGGKAFTYLSFYLSLSLSLHTHIQTHIHIFPSRDVGVANAKLWLTKLNLHKNGGQSQVPQSAAHARVCGCLVWALLLQCPIIDPGRSLRT